MYAAGAAYQHNNSQLLIRKLKETESYGTVLPCGTVYYAVQGGSNF